MNMGITYKKAGVDISEIKKSQRAIGKLIEYIPGVAAIQNVLAHLNNLWEFFDKIELMVDQFIEEVKQKIEAEILKVEDKAREKLAEHGVPQNHLEGVMSHLTPMLSELRNNWWEMVKQGLWEMIWPIPGVWSDIKSTAFINAANSAV